MKKAICVLSLVLFIEIFLISLNDVETYQIDYIVFYEEPAENNVSNETLETQEQQTEKQEENLEQQENELQESVEQQTEVKEQTQEIQEPSIKQKSTVEPSKNYTENIVTYQPVEESKEKQEEILEPKQEEIKQEQPTKKVDYLKAQKAQKKQLIIILAGLSICLVITLIFIIKHRS